MEKMIFVVFVLFISGCIAPDQGDVPRGNENIGPVSDGLEVSSGSKVEIENSLIEEPSVLEEIEVPVLVGPGGCVGDECELYCSKNSGVCAEWCNDHPADCEQLLQGRSIEEPDQPINNTGGQERESEIIEPIELGPGLRAGDGIWEKSELTVYLKDLENKLTRRKRSVILSTLISNSKYEGGYLGWNSALEELNAVYPDNTVPNNLSEIDSEQGADIIFEVFSEKEYCCDLSGKPITGYQRNYNDANAITRKSYIGLYDIVDIDEGFLGDVTRHEFGHSLGLFGHTDRKNDLMSLASPAIPIKRGNLDDLYEKYSHFVPEDIETVREREIARGDYN